MEKYTAEGLPVISRASIERYIKENHVAGSFRETLDRPDLGQILREENPELFNYVSDLKTFHEQRGETEIAKAIVTGVGIVYMLLRSQADANKLAESQ